MRRLPALISIHDVMPGTLDDVARLLRLLEDRGLVPATLLVVPGVGWTADGLARLRAWQARGHRLAGHGWLHRAVAERTPGHRLHAALLSRDSAEHLSRPRATLRALLASNHAWFARNGLEPPRLYVPPAWALGSLDRRDLLASPFALVETLTGVHQVRTGGFSRLPVVGFEADTPGRAAALRGLNALARMTASHGRPLRVALHPRDLALRLAADLRHTLAMVGPHLAYETLLPGRAPAPGGSARLPGRAHR